MHRFWRAVYTLLTINLLGFLAVIGLVRPNWFDINRFLSEAIGTQAAWVNIILALSLLLCITVWRMRSKPAGIFRRLLPWPIFAIYNAMLYLLLSEMGSELGIIELQFFELLPLTITLLLLALLIVVLPGWQLWQHRKLRIGVLLGILLGGILFMRGGPSIVAGPYLQNPHSLNVMWVTDKECLGWVEIDGRRIYSSRDGLRNVGRIHRVELGDVAGGTSYRVFAREVRNIFPINATFGPTVSSGPKTIRKAAGDRFSFLVLNDLHENVSLFHQIISSDYATACDFIVLNGDFFNHVDSHYQIVSRLLRPADALDGAIPFILTRGNHETRGALARKLPEYLGTPYYQAFDYGQARIIILDGGEDKRDDHEEYSGLVDFGAYRRDQLAWLQQELTGWQPQGLQIALNHIPFNEFQLQEEPFNAYQRDFCRLLGDAGLELMLSGHWHETRYFEPTASSSFNILWGGGDAYEDGAYRPVLVEVDGSSATVRVIDVNGETLQVHQVPGS